MNTTILGSTFNYLSFPIAAALAMFLIICPRSSAETVGWHPLFKGQVGEGLNLRNQKEIKLPIAIVDSTPQPYSGTGDAQMNVYFAQHQFDLAQSFSLNMNLSLDAFVTSGNVGFDFTKTQTFSQNSLTFAFTCVRNFGDMRRPILGMAPEFTNYVNNLKRSLTGPALYKAVTDHYGTHFIAGFSSAARVFVLYTFNFGSSSVMQDSRYHVNASYDFADFQSRAHDFLQQQDTKVSLSYSFYTTDPANPAFPKFGQITNYNQFLSFNEQLTQYCNTMNPANAQKSAYIIQSIENLPGFLTLMDNNALADQPNADYARFMKAFAALRSWGDWLDDVALDTQRLSWLNPDGMLEFLAIRADVAKYLVTLERKAKEHFQSGADLTVPTDIFNYLVNINRLKIPTISLGTLGDEPNNLAVMIGYLNCGSVAHTIPEPFRYVATRPNHRDENNLNIVWYSANDFMTQALREPEPFRTSANAFFASSKWQTLTQAMATTRLGFFLASWPVASADSTFLAIKDAAANVVAENSVLRLGNDQPAQNPQAAPTSDLSLGVSNAPAGGILGSKVVYTFSVTNNGPGAAYGVAFSVPVAKTLEFVSITGSQGQGAYENGAAHYEVGPLPRGAVATVQLVLLPLLADTIEPSVVAKATNGRGLAEVSLANNLIELPALSVSSPLISAELKKGQIELSWTSDSDRILLEEASILHTGALWTPVTSPTVTAESHRETTIAPSGSRKFYRLHGP